MSKNGYRLFRNYDPYITSPFGYRINPLTKVRSLHAGVDYGTNGQKLPTYALEDGKVIKTGYSNISGNFVYVNYKRLGKNAIYEHLDSIKVQKGDEVSKDTIIGYVGATGEVTGVHLHFGWFNESEQEKDWYSRNWEDFEQYDYQEERKVLGIPTVRNNRKKQIEITINNLYVRDNPDGNILGYLKPGIYDVLESKVLKDYTWYKISDNYWVAYSKDFGNLYEEEIKEEIKEETLDPSLDNKEEKDEGQVEIKETNTKEVKDEVKKVNAFWLFLKRLREFIKKILVKLGFK